MSAGAKLGRMFVAPGWRRIDTARLAVCIMEQKLPDLLVTQTNNTKTSAHLRGIVSDSDTMQMGTRPA